MRRLLFSLLALFLIPAPAFAAMTFDNANLPSGTFSASPAYYTLTVGASATAICVGDTGAVSGTDSTTNVQIGTVAGTSTATKEGGIEIPSDRYTDLWCLVNPPTGVVTVQVTFTGSFLNTGAASYTGVGSIDAANPTTGASASTFAQTTSTIQNNAWVFSMAGEAAGRTHTAGSNTTVRATNANGMSLQDSGAAITPAGSATINLSMSVSQSWAGTIVALEPISATIQPTSLLLAQATWW